jgi:hypothetical protein
MLCLRFRVAGNFGLLTSRFCQEIKNHLNKPKQMVEAAGIEIGSEENYFFAMVRHAPQNPCH